MVGSVEFDGVPLDQVPRPLLRGSLSVVDQDIVTFSDTVYDNVTLWDSSVEDFEVILTCRDAAIHQEIVTRKDGYHAMVAPRGRNFSGGQLQRMEIARALMIDPSIIILDEATSALDAQTEAEVIRRIRDRDVTCIVVAHRLSTHRRRHPQDAPRHADPGLRGLGRRVGWAAPAATDRARRVRRKAHPHV